MFDLQVEGDPSYTANGFISHNSAMPLQMMESRGFKTAVLSVDRNKAPYYAWRTGFEEGRIRLYRQYQMMREAEELIDGDKVDHPVNGTKDATDSAAGAYFNAINSKDFAATTAAGGIPMGVYGDKELGAEDEKPPIILPIAVGPKRSARTFNA